MRRALAVDPGAVLLVHPEDRGRHRLHRGLAFLHQRRDRIAHRCEAMAATLSPFSGTKASRNTNRADVLVHLLGDARDDDAAIGVADQHDVLEPLPFDHVDDVGHVGGEIDLGIEQVRALAQPGHGRREHLVAALLQEIGDAPPAPAAVPGAVHQHEGLRRWSVPARNRWCRRAWCSPPWRLSRRGGGCVIVHRSPPHSRYLQQGIDQPFRRIDHHVVAGSDRLQGLPRSCRPCIPRRPCRTPAADSSRRGCRSSSPPSRARR